MPVINPLWLAELRRQWPLAGAVALFLVFLLAHVVFFQPTARRYQRAQQNAKEAGLSLDQMATPEVIPPRVYAMLAENALPAAKAKDAGDSGALSASLIETISRLATKRRMAVIVAEPAPTTQQTQSVIVRAHVRLRASYAEFVGFLGDLAATEHLLAVDRFSLQPSGGGDLIADLYVSRYVLKQAPAKP